MIVSAIKKIKQSNETGIPERRLGPAGLEAALNGFWVKGASHTAGAEAPRWEPLVRGRNKKAGEGGRQARQLGEKCTQAPMGWGTGEREEEMRRGPCFLQAWGGAGLQEKMGSFCFNDDTEETLFRRPRGGRRQFVAAC